MANKDWLYISQLSGNSGTTTITVSAGTNTNISDRNVLLTVTSNGGYQETVLVLQDANVSTLNVSPTSITSNYEASIGIYSFEITTTLSWTVTSKPSWITLSSTSGTGNTVVYLSFNENTGETQTGEIIITNGIESKSVNVVQYKDFSKDYFTIEAESNGIVFSLLNSNQETIGNVWFSKNEGEWTTYNGEYISLNTGDTIRLYGTNKSYYSYNNNYYCGCTGGNYKIYGNIMSLISGQNFVNKKTFSSSWVFRSFFSNFSGLTSAENLILPVETLTNYCYGEMFAGCTSLVNAPKLPATRITGFSYYGMFSGCTSLVNAPELPATRMGTPGAAYDEHWCYAYMFAGCTSLTTAPALPATILTESCYEAMFINCTSLVNAPALPATSLEPVCYEDMFEGCTSLVTAPELPATTLATNCYYGMFNGCTNLNYIKCLAKNPSTGISPNFGWVNGVASTGTFVKKSGVSWSTGIDGIPEGWTVQNV